MKKILNLFSRLSSPKIHCIGDSHASFFSGSDAMQNGWPKKSKDRLSFFRSYRLGPVLAYNLCCEGRTSKGRENLLDLLGYLPQKSKVLLCFGEIDCRLHLLKQKEKQNKPLDFLVDDCVQRYFKVVREISNGGYNVMVWNVIASSWKDMSDASQFPTYGSCLERNNVTRLFNNRLSEMCKQDGIVFVSIFEQLLLKDGTTNPAFYQADGIHLSQKAMPMAIEAIRPFAPEINFK